LNKVHAYWKKYWFSLRDDVLLYSASQDSDVSRGEMRISDVVKVAAAEEPELKEQFPFSFKIFTPQRIIYVYADTSREMYEWMHAINILSTFDHTYTACKKLKTDPNSALKMANFRCDLMNSGKAVLGNMLSVLGYCKTLEANEDQKGQFATLQLHLKNGTLFFIESILKTVIRPFDRVPKRKVIVEAKDLSYKLVKLDTILVYSPEKAALDVALNALRPRLLDVSRYVVTTKLIAYDELTKIGYDIIAITQNISDNTTYDNPANYRKIEALMQEFVTHVNSLNQPKLTSFVFPLPSLVENILATKNAQEDDSDVGFFTDLLYGKIVDTLRMVRGKEGNPKEAQGTGGSMLWINKKKLVP